MITRSEVVSNAALKCLKEIYSKAQPAVDWDDFMQQNKDYSKKYEEWKELIRKGENITLESFCGPRPYEFYYLPQEIFKEIADSYVDAYCIDSQQDLLNIIDILKDYCLSPIKESYTKESDGETHRGYIHPDNIKKTVQSLLQAFYLDSDCDSSYITDELVKIFFGFLDDAGKFYCWNRYLNAFNSIVYLGPSPCSNKETVIKNWKNYRNKDIIIDDSLYIEDEEN